MADSVCHFGDLSLTDRDSFLEVAFDKRSIEHHELDFSPLWVVLVLLADDTDNLLKVVPIGPKLPI